MIDLEECLRCHLKLDLPRGICTVCALWYQGGSLPNTRGMHRCIRCSRPVTPGFFCVDCYGVAYPSEQAVQITDNPHRLCPHCGRLKYYRASICPACGPVTRFDVPVVQLTPEQLAQWLKEVRT